MDRQTPGSTEIDATDLEWADIHPSHHQRSARTDASMRDGDSGHGNPGENHDDGISIDNDVGDSEEGDPGGTDLLELFADRHGADGIDPDADPELTDELGDDANHSSQRDVKQA